MRSDEGTLQKLEAAAANHPAEGYTLEMYVVGMNPRTARAIERVREFCREHLTDRHSLDIYDLETRPELARTAGILGAPTLIKSAPLPRRQLVGDMRDETRLLSALGLSV